MSFLCRCFQTFCTCALGFIFELHHCLHETFHLLTFCFHCHHLAFWFLFFIFVVGCKYALVFIKSKNQGLRGFFFFLFVLWSPSSFPHTLVFVPICNSSPPQCAFIFISIMLNLCLGVHFHLHCA